jgi:hypothetical protein
MEHKGGVVWCEHTCEQKKCGLRNYVRGCDSGCGENSNELICCVKDRELNG